MRYTIEGNKTVFSSLSGVFGGKKTMHHRKNRGIVLIPDDFSADWITWMAQDGLDVLKLHMIQKENDLLPFLETGKGKEILRRAGAANIDIEYEIHAFSLLLPRGFFVENPDLFRMDIRGNRTPDCNFCPSNPETLAIVKKSAVELADRMRPTMHRFFLWPDDGGNWCHCPRCEGFSASDQNTLVMNALRKALRTVDPEARLACLSYEKTLPPPSQVKPDPGLFLEWAPIRRCYRHAINDPACVINREHAEGLRALLKVFNPQDAQILEYWMDASMFSQWKRPAVKLPFDGEIMRKDLDYYHALGINSVTSFGCFLDAEYVALHGKPPVREYADILRELA